MNMNVLSSIAVADELVPRLNSQIIAKCGDNIWDGICKDSKRRMSHQDLENLDEDARIFTDEGVEILRYLHCFQDRQRKPCGAMVDFKNLYTLFEPDIHLDYARAGPSQPESSYFAYPQAGLVTAGHLQAKSLVSDFYPLLEHINTGILGAEGEGAADELLVEAPKWPVYGVSCQIYNAVMHHTRGFGSQHHEVARGMVSGALGGQCVPKTASSGKAKHLLERLQYKLPHEEYEIKASNVEVSKDLRVENVYWVDLDQFPEEDRNGR